MTKRKKLRHSEYYDLQGCFDELYAKSKQGDVFTNLIEIISSEENIRLAYRNIKRNSGSQTSGVDKLSIKDIERLSIEKLVEIIQKKFKFYKPKPVKRVEIPKPNGKTRPLGIPTIVDRWVQQCILQVLEPICEAKFHERSNGFRPNRSAEHALAQCYRMIQQQNLHFVVDVDIKGFFDNVNHSKLIRQMWTLGIRDKQLICIIKEMLKAPIIMPDGSTRYPTKGTPQGGILSPLLANIVLNELDWWISSQWENMPTHNKYKIIYAPNGTVNKGIAYRALRTSRLKEMYIVRYADDFKIFCRKRSDADKVFIAVKQWLNDRLSLEISEEKSKVVNLKRHYSEFLGFKLKAVRKGGNTMPVNKDERVTKKKNGLFRYRVRVNYIDANGNSQQIERLVWGKAEAEAVEQELIAEYKDKHLSVSSRMTVAELVEKYEQYHAAETRRSTHRNTMKNLRLRVLPYLKDQRIDRLTQSVLAEWKVAIAKENIALQTKQNAYKSFCSMLNYAVKMEFIPKNNLSVLGNFKDTAVLEKPSEKIHYYTAEQFERFISVAKSECKTVIDWGYFVFFSIAFLTGARKGEINALKWSDIDGNILHIRRSITQKLKGGDVETAPKNRSSIRDLQLPAPLIAVLEEHKQRQRDAAPKHFTEDFRICGGMIPLRDTSIDKRNRKYADMAGLPRIKIHDYRHSHVSLLANEGINIQEVARRLGHSNVQETWNTYCHLYPREEERAVEVLNRISIG